MATSDPLQPIAAPDPNMPNLARLREFIIALGDLIERAQDDEPTLLQQGGPLLGELVRHDDWLPEAYAEADPQRYRQYLLHCDSRQRFSVVSFVWGPGQSTPIHDHTVWGLVGVLRGAELNERFDGAAASTPNGHCSSGGGLTSAGIIRLEVGQVAAVSPTVGDVHRVSNAYGDRSSISIHVYGANIGAVERFTYDATGAAKRFVSGYSNQTLPNVWDRSGEL